MQFQQSLRLMDMGPTIGALREKFQAMARNELQRQRRQLGQLSTEQEAAIEQLLISTVNKISHPVLNQMRRFYEASDHETMQELSESSDPEE
jgi:glutamyl-tRNA reductase